MAQDRISVRDRVSEEKILKSVVGENYWIPTEKLSPGEQDLLIQRRNVFGVTAEHNEGVLSIEMPIIDEYSITSLIFTAHNELRERKRRLEEAGQYTDAANLDIKMKPDQLTLTDYERATEFLDLNNNRTDPKAFKSVWDHEVANARDNIDLLLPDKYQKKSAYGTSNPGEWRDRRNELISATLQRIEEVDEFVEKTWLKTGKTPVLPLNRPSDRTPKIT